MQIVNQPQPLLYLLGVGMLIGVLVLECFLKRSDVASKSVARRKAAGRDWLSELALRIVGGLVGLYFCLGLAALIPHGNFFVQALLSIPWLGLICYIAWAAFETLRDIRLAQRKWSIRGLMLLTTVACIYFAALQWAGAYSERIFFVTIYTMAVFLLLRRTAFRYGY